MERACDNRLGGERIGSKVIALERADAPLGLRVAGSSAETKSGDASQSRGIPGAEGRCRSAPRQTVERHDHKCPVTYPKRAVECRSQEAASAG